MRERDGRDGGRKGRGGKDRRGGKEGREGIVPPGKLFSPLESRLNTEYMYMYDTVQATDIQTTRCNKTRVARTTQHERDRSTSAISSGPSYMTRPVTHSDRRVVLVTEV